jgi:putative acetyltransferase
MTQPSIRRFRPEDGPGVISVILSVYRTLGYEMDFEQFDRDLADIAAFYQDSGGEFWVLEDRTEIAGCVGVTIEGGERCELHRLYLLSSNRGKGWGRKLIRAVEGWSESRGFGEIILWSDIRFETAREVYIRCGFEPTTETRAIDPVNPGSIERLFVKSSIRKPSRPV